MTSDSSPEEQTGATGTVRTSDRDDGVGDGPSRTICSVCQRPLPEDRMQRWRAEPVHVECGAELRCAITLGRRSE